LKVLERGRNLRNPADFWGRGRAVNRSMPGGCATKSLNDTANKWILVNDTDIIKGVPDNIRLVGEKPIHRCAIRE
jgi:hypothetical protein